MTAHTTPSPAGPPLDTHDMVVIHRAFRRESLLLASLIAGVEDGDRRRARALAAHLRWYRLGLHNHHAGEDELLWPLLHARADLESEVGAPDGSTARAGRRVARPGDAGPARLGRRRPARPSGTALAARLRRTGPCCSNISTTRKPTCSRWPGGISPSRNGMPWASTSWPVRLSASCSLSSARSWRTPTASERASVLAAMPVPARLIWQTYRTGQLRPAHKRTRAWPGERPAWPASAPLRPGGPGPNREQGPRTAASD